MSNEITRGKKKFSFISMGLIFFLPGPKAPIINGTVKKGPKNKLRINHINGVPNVVLYPLHNITKELIIKIIHKKIIIVVRFFTSLFEFIRLIRFEIDFVKYSLSVIMYYLF